jgi:hypothetical protein
MCRPKIKRGADRAVPLIVATAAGIWLSGCSNADLYLDRREAVCLSASDAIAANQATQQVDPWPAYSGDKNLGFNGQKMQTAVERYRSGKVTDPVDPMNLETNNASGQTINTTVTSGGSTAGGSTAGDSSSAASSNSGQ